MLLYMLLLYSVYIIQYTYILLSMLLIILYIYLLLFYCKFHLPSAITLMCTLKYVGCRCIYNNKTIQYPIYIYRCMRNILCTMYIVHIYIYIKKSSYDTGLPIYLLCDYITSIFHT